MASLPDPTPSLVDRFGRRVSYVRLSVTDRCDLRCVYCMSEQMTFVPRAQLLTLEELAVIGRSFVELGVNKIRITGGEPLVRRDVLKLFQELGQLSGLKELTLTTNGTQLDRLAVPLREAGVRRVNISLDSLDPERFRRISRVGDLGKVLRGIEAAQAAGFDRIKLNTVAIQDRDNDEVLALLEFALERNLDIVFIEEMPFGAGADPERGYLLNSAVQEIIRNHYDLLQTTENTGGPATYFRIPGKMSRVGFISPHSHNFCASCNRVRVTTEGRLLLCLGQEHSVDLKQVLRRYPGDSERLKQTLIGAMQIKPWGHEFDPTGRTAPIRAMSMTGG